MDEMGETGNGGQGPSAYERGKKDAGVAAELDAHNSRLDKIAAAIEKSATGMLALEAVVREQGVDARLAAVALTSAAEALATETEARRIVLADNTAVGNQKYTRREKLFGLLVVTAGVLIAFLTAVNPPG